MTDQSPPDDRNSPPDDRDDSPASAYTDDGTPIFSPETDRTGIARLLLEREGPGTYYLDFAHEENGTRLTWVPSGGVESRSVSVGEVFSPEQQAIAGLLEGVFDARTNTKVRVEWDEALEGG